MTTRRAQSFRFETARFHPGAATSQASCTAQPMITPNEHALENAARALREKALKRVGESIEIFRGFRKVEEHRLRMWHHAGAGGREVARQRSPIWWTSCSRSFSKESSAPSLQKASPSHLS